MIRQHLGAPFVTASAMMRILTTYIILLSCLSLQTQCQTKPANTSQQESVITKVEFTTLTRGQKKEVFISADSVVEVSEGLSNEHAVVKRKIESAQWQALLATVKGANLEEVPNLPSPTTRRAFDGARHSSIKITTADGRDFTHAFDDENPHQMLQPLMDEIIRLIGPMR